MNYLINQDVITDDDYQIFKDKRNNSMLNNLKTIIEESYVLDNIKPPITLKKFEKFEKKIGGIIKTKKYKTLMNRCMIMYQRDEHSGYSQYDFRYIIGEIVSSLWFEQYSMMSSNKKHEKLRRFFAYLSQTHTLDLESACKQLVGLEIGNIFYSYINHFQEKTA